MKLAAALAHRADLANRRAALVERAQRSALAQEGTEPADDPAALLDEIDRVSSALEELVVRINVTNARAQAAGMSLTAALARRDTLRATHAVLARVADAATQGDRVRGQELRLIPTIAPRQLRERADRVAQDLRELDLAIQEVNWTTELER